MNRSGAPGITKKDVSPQLKSALDHKVDPTLNIYYPIIDLSGSGVFYQASIYTDDGVTSIIRGLKVTLDGVTYMGPYSANAVSSIEHFIEHPTLLSVGAKLPMYLSFKNSLLIEMMTNTTLVAGKRITGIVKYGEN